MSTHTVSRGLIFKMADVIRHVEKYLVVLCAVIFMCMMFLGTADVGGRYLLNKPILGAQELTAIMMGAIVLFGWAYTQNRGEHVKVDLFYNMFSPRIQKILTIISLILALGLFVLITWQSWEIAVKYIQEERRFKVIDMPSGYFYLLVPFGGFFMCLELILGIFDHIVTLVKRQIK
jgi:TRAP-type C4-dicarboxylate transport system permease small subunit